MTIWTLSTCAFGLLSLSALHIPASLNSNCVFDLFSLSVQVSFALTSTCTFGLLSLNVLHIPASLNSNCVFDLFSLSVQVSFALTSTCAFGLLSLSALHKKSGHTHAILCLPRRSALLYSHAPCRCPYTDHSASVSRMSKFIIRDLSQNCKLHFSKWT